MKKSNPNAETKEKRSRHSIASPEQTRLLGNSFTESEVVIAFVGAVGVDLRKVEDLFVDRLRATGYNINNIGITKDVIPLIRPNIKQKGKRNEYVRISMMMDVGNDIRKETGNNGILALGVSAQIAKVRGRVRRFLSKAAFLIRSLKRPEEVRLLREIYPRGFYLVGVHADRERRQHHLTSHRQMTPQQATELMDRDMDEGGESGQQIVDTFHLSDFFVRLEGNDDRLKSSVWRIVDLMFSNPHCTPAFSEHAMFLAFASSLRSGDLSRQVGAVIARDGEILSTGANDCPKPGGGLYWPVFCNKKQIIKDLENGRDSIRGRDSNKFEQLAIIESIVVSLRKAKGISDKKIRRILEASPISDLTEFGRVVHAEMEALLSCARKGITTKGATMYCTTFPCHNCAKHIIAAGIDRVVFIEPYLKSKATKLHDDAIKIDYTEAADEVDQNTTKVRFQPFVGVGPRRFFELFSMNLGVGAPMKRKDNKGVAAKWETNGATLRIQMLPKSYLGLEEEAKQQFDAAISRRR